MRARFEAAVRWALLVLGSAVLLVYLSADIGFFFSRVNVWPGTWIYAVFVGVEVGVLLLVVYITAVRRSSRDAMWRNLVVAIWALNLTSLAISFAGFYGFM